MLVKGLPLSDTVLVLLTTLNGSLGFARFTDRLAVTEDISPPGVMVVTVAGIGDCKPKRGSGPSCRKVAEPSASQFVVPPSEAVSEILVPPSAPMVVRSRDPLGNVSSR